MNAEIHQIEWEGITLRVNYVPSQWGITSHIEVESIAPERAPLPITETGYRSHFVPIGTVEAEFDSVQAYVRAWLDELAKCPEWQGYLASTVQGELF